MRMDRRGFLKRSSGLAVLGVGGLVLSAEARPTEALGELGAYGDFLKDRREPIQEAPAMLTATEPNILGPYYREGSPYRAKISPPLASGEALVVTGRVWGVDTRRPLAGAVLDIWHADSEGHYDNDDPVRPPAENVFVNRARLVTDEQGRYEYETIRPGHYPLGPNRVRTSHIHYLVRARGYATLVTQLFFSDDPMNARDDFILPSLVIDLETVAVRESRYWTGTFDVVLEPE